MVHLKRSAVNLGMAMPHQMPSLTDFIASGQSRKLHLTSVYEERNKSCLSNYTAVCAASVTCLFA